MITQGRDARRAPRPQLSAQQQQHTQPAGRRGAIEWSEANKMAETNKARDFDLGPDTRPAGGDSPPKRLEFFDRKGGIF